MIASAPSPARAALELLADPSWVETHTGTTLRPPVTFQQLVSLCDLDQNEVHQSLQRLVCARTGSGATALHLVQLVPQDLPYAKALASQLLAAGANPFDTSCTGMPASMACRSGGGMLTLFLEHLRGAVVPTDVQQALWHDMACMEDRTSAVLVMDLLLKHFGPSEADCRDTTGRTPLSRFLETELVLNLEPNLKLVKRLLKLRADPNVRVPLMGSQATFTPVSLAMCCWNLSVVELLCQYGGDLTVEMPPYKVPASVRYAELANRTPGELTKCQRDK